MKKCLRTIWYTCAWFFSQIPLFHPKINNNLSSKRRIKGEQPLTVFFQFHPKITDADFKYSVKLKTHPFQFPFRFYRHCSPLSHARGFPTIFHLLPSIHECIFCNHFASMRLTFVHFPNPLKRVEKGSFFSSLKNFAGRMCDGQKLALRPWLVFMQVIWKAINKDIMRRQIGILCFCLIEDICPASKETRACVFLSWTLPIGKFISKFKLKSAFYDV